MPKTQTNCPRCRSPLVADVEQLFDVSSDPQAKQRLLSGDVNVARCPTCGYEGNLPIPIVYHDANKEFLLTYFPPELGMPVNEQERMIGPLINKVVDRLPNEKRKAYLFRPQTMFTYQTLIEKILEGDGITKEMLDEQQKRLNLLQRLLSTAEPETRSEIIKLEEDLIDQSFFAILTRLIEATLAQGDEQSAKQLAAFQQELVSQTKVGKELQDQAQESQAAIADLQKASKEGLTREKLLDLMIEAPNDTRLTTLVSLTRSGLDYSFFQLLSGRIENTLGEEKTKLEAMRTKILNLTQEIDQQIQKEIQSSNELLNQILASDNMEQSIEEILPEINEFFVEALNQQIQNARQGGDLNKIAKLQKIADVIEKASTPPPEVEFIEKLMSAEDDAALQTTLEENSAMLTDEFAQLLNGLVTQSEAQGQPPEVVESLKKINRAVLRQRMKANLSN
ncbi:MAG: CpXC domain-containing protein [Anaerolineaceae bacterium]